MWTAVRSVVDVKPPATHTKMSEKVGHLALPPCLPAPPLGVIRILLEKKLFTASTSHQRVYLCDVPSLAPPGDPNLQMQVCPPTGGLAPPLHTIVSSSAFSCRNLGCVTMCHRAVCRNLELPARGGTHAITRELRLLTWRSPGTVLALAVW